MSNPELQQLERELEAAAVHFSMADRQRTILSEVDPAQSASVSEARVVSAARDVLERVDREPVDQLLARSESGPLFDRVDQRQWRAFLGRVRSQLRAPRPSVRLKVDDATTGESRSARRPPSAFAAAARNRRPGPFGLLVAGTLLVGTLLVIAIRLTTVEGAECDGPDCPGGFAIASGTVEDVAPPVGPDGGDADPAGSERSDPSDAVGARSALGVGASDVDPENEIDSSAEADDDRSGATTTAPGTDTTAAPDAGADDRNDEDGAEEVGDAEPLGSRSPSTTTGSERADEADGSDRAGPTSSEGPTTSSTERSTTSSAPPSSQARQPSTTREVTTTTRPTTTERPTTTARSTTEAPTTTTTRPTTTERPTTTQPPVTEALAPIERAPTGVACPGGSPTGSRNVDRVVDDDVLNVRLGPGTGFDIVFGLAPDATGVQVFEGSTSGSWMMVLIPGRSIGDPAGQSCGWSHTAFLTAG